MSRILAITILSLAGIAAAQANSWTPVRHIGFSAPFLDLQSDDGTPPDTGCQTNCNNDGPFDDSPSNDGPIDDGPVNDGPVKTDAASVPEPGTFALLGVGLLLAGVGLGRRRSKLTL